MSTEVAAGEFEYTRDVNRKLRHTVSIVAFTEAGESPVSVIQLNPNDGK